MLGVRLILFKGQRNKPEYSDNLPPGPKVFMTPKRSMTAEIFVKWVDHFSQYKPSGRVLLIFDGAKSHSDAKIIATDEYLCLPGNCRHELMIDKFILRYLNIIGTMDWNIVFSKVWSKVVTPTNVANGFRATGIYSYDPIIILERAYALSQLSEKHLNMSEFMRVIQQAGLI